MPRRPAWRRSRGIIFSMEHDDLTDDLAAFLDSAGRDDAYRVERVLKVAPAERTELVYFAAGNGSELGPFVRKRIDLAAGGGGAYEVIWRAQRRGARLVHLPRIIDCRREGYRLTVVVDYVAGGALEELVAREGASADLARRVGPAICDAVAELHGIVEPPIIHRDLKPSNVIMAGDVPVIIDFGIARVYRAGGEADTTRFGTRGYAAPEQYGFGQTSVRSDVYALGMLLCFCCTGEQPAGVPGADALARAGVHDNLARVILRASAFDPATRYACAADMRSDLVALDAAGRVGRCLDSAAASDGEAREPAMPSLPVHEPRRASGGVSPLWSFLRLPAAVGRAWNGILVLMGAAFAVACCDVVVHPTPEIASSPMWYNAAIAVLLVLPVGLLTLALMADRRRWTRELPIVGAPTSRNLVLAGIKVAVAGVAVLMLITPLA